LHEFEGDVKIVSVVLKPKSKAIGPEAKAKTIKFGLETPRGLQHL